MPHDWLRAVAQQPANYYKEVEVDHRAKDTLLKALQKRIRLQPDKFQCQEIRKVLPGFFGRERFVEAWKPCDLILTSRLKDWDRAQKCCSSVMRSIFRTPRCPSSIVRKTQGGRTSWLPSPAPHREKTPCERTTRRNNAKRKDERTSCEKTKRRHVKRQQN